MKGLFKFASVALALVAFASCSSDDLFHKGENAQQNKGILVEVEDMIDATTTRASYTPTGKTGTLNWNTGDQIRVSDGTMVKYDIYKYDGESAFVFDVDETGRSAAYVAEPKYAVYPNTTMLWDNAKMQAWGQFNIASSYTWGEDTETDGAYYAKLPLWGTAEADATYGVKTSLKYLSGILRINVDNLPNNADHIKVTGWKNLAGTEEAPMSGSFKAVFATDDVLNEEATLEPLGGNNNYITVDVSSASKAKSVIFVPLIAQTYGLLEIQYSKDGGITYNNDMKVVENLTVERRKFYNLTYNSFKFAGDDPAAISAVLEEKKADSEINIETANPTAVSSTNNTITIPETSANITLTLKDLTASGASALNIVAAKDYAGTLVINVANAPTISNIMINLPKANVVFNDCQNMAAVSLGADNAPDNNAASGMVAKTLTINAKTKLNAIYANAELGLGNSDGADLKLAKGSQVGTIEFEKNYKADNIEICGTVTNALDMTTWKDRNGKDIACTATIGNGASIPALTITGDVTVTGGTITGALRTNGNVTVKGVTGGSGANATTKGTVGSIAPYTNPSSNVTTTITLENQGTVTGDITPTAKHFFTLEVKDQASVGGTATVNSLTIAGTTANVANAIVNGNATITNTAEAEAVTGTITMNCSAARTLTLNGGYVNTITQSGSKNLTIQHGTAANYTAIASITGTANKIIIDTNTKSVWNGKKIGVVPSGANAAVTAAQNALKAKYATGKDKIYTANQLATSDAAAELWSNIDLNNQPWNGPALAGNFAGKDMNPTVTGNQLPTIENVKLTAAANNGSINGVGLFATATANATLSNFTLKNVTSNITEANGKNVTSVGALIGDAGAKDITVSSVTVNNAEVGATIADNIGGLIGNTTGAIELNKVNVSGLTLNGQFYVGGIVGKTTGAITINGANTTTVNVTAINVPASFNAEPDIKTLAAGETKYGTVGMIAGQSATAVSDASSKLTVNDLITGNRQRLGYKMCYKDPGADVKYYYGVRGDDHTNIHVWVGRITGATVDDITTLKGFEDGWKTQSLNAFMVKHDIYDSCDE